MWCLGRPFEGMIFVLFLDVRLNGKLPERLLCDPGQRLIPHVQLLSRLPPCVGGKALFELAGSVGGSGREGSRSSEGQRQPEWMAG